MAEGLVEEQLPVTAIGKYGGQYLTIDRTLSLEFSLLA